MWSPLYGSSLTAALACTHMLQGAVHRRCSSCDRPLQGAQRANARKRQGGWICAKCRSHGKPEGKANADVDCLLSLSLSVVNSSLIAAAAAATSPQADPLLHSVHHAPSTSAADFVQSASGAPAPAAAAFTSAAASAAPLPDPALHSPSSQSAQINMHHALWRAFTRAVSHSIRNLIFS